MGLELRLARAQPVLGKDECAKLAGAHLFDGRFQIVPDLLPVGSEGAISEATAWAIACAHASTSRRKTELGESTQRLDSLSQAASTPK